MRRLAPILALAAGAGGLLLALGAAASPAGQASASAWAVQITVPGTPAPAGTPALTAPSNSAASGGAFAYPSDGSIVSAGSTTVSVSSAPGARPASEAAAALTAVSLFGGEIVANAVTGNAHALANGATASGEPGLSGIDGLTILGKQIAPAPNEHVAIGTWGTATVLAEKGSAGHGPSSGFDEAVTALEVVLTAAHGGLPAGSEIAIGHAEAWARPTGTVASAAAPGAIPTITIAAAGAAKTASRPPAATPKLGERGYVFPVYGSVAFGDTFGADRSDVSGGWHHGDDIFAPLGTPLVAVAHGVVFSVGWEKVGGWRLWLRDDVGNEFYYAHLSAYSPLAVNGAIVNAGDVLGFVGDTGDAEGTPYHLHFEVHPTGLLQRGYDGAVDPTTYLDAWRHLKYLRYRDVAGWTPRVLSAVAPKAGAVLLQSTDISAASGLDPASVARVLAPAR
jgi:murein DD-endopeptidase MepM/ murein hydrolase activator NlpD